MRQILIFGSSNTASRYAADLFVNQVQKKKSSVLGLATGKTMIPFYNFLVKKKMDFSRVKTFNLDEYYGAGFWNKDSLRRFMDENFFSKVNLSDKNVNFLDGLDKAWKKVCLDYEKVLKRNKIDLQILGIGRNGHIGFNEPGSDEESKTSKVKLTAETRKVNRVKYDSALTMGVGTILRAKKIVLLATGKEKAEIVKKALEGDISRKVPASFLRKHKDVVFVLDRDAARKLKKLK